MQTLPRDYLVLPACFTLAAASAAAAAVVLVLRSPVPRAGPLSSLSLSLSLCGCIAAATARSCVSPRSLPLPPCLCVSACVRDVSSWLCKRSALTAAADWSRAEGDRLEPLSLSCSCCLLRLLLSSPHPACLPAIPSPSPPLIIPEADDHRTDPQTCWRRQQLRQQRRRQMC